MADSSVPGAVGERPDLMRHFIDHHTCLHDEWQDSIEEASRAILDGGSGGAVGEREGLDSQALDLLTACAERNIYSRFDMEYAFQPWALDVERLAEAGANVLDGRRIGSVRLYRNTITPDDWQALATEYARLSVNEGVVAPVEPQEPQP